MENRLMPDGAASGRPATAGGEAVLGWARDAARFAFQPIVDPYTGALYGVEALLRGYDTLGFSGVHEVFDAAYEAGVLRETELAVRTRAITQFAAMRRRPSTRLFLNIDNRILQADGYHPGETLRTVADVGLSPTSISIEISERHEVRTADHSTQTLTQAYRSQSFRVAIDDFGAGYSGLKLLYEQHPDFIKIDRFFISGIETDRTKKLFVSQIVNLAQVLGIAVVAEGVETEHELLTCKEMGCNLVQGYFIEQPLIDGKGLRAEYAAVAACRNNRKGDADSRFIAPEMTTPPAIPINTRMMDVFEHFRAHKNMTHFPVIDEGGEPLGLVHEEDLKDYTYSRYGKDLLANNSFRKSLRDFTRPCPVADIRDDAERILEKFTLNANAEGIIVVENMAYAGFLTAGSLLHVMNEKHLAMARDENPLSKLPGNNRIVEFVGEILRDTERCVTLAYFDFDNFKPFNDTYGFRQGDRAILLFSELMKKAFIGTDAFLGHVGGDDFFAGWCESGSGTARQRVARLRAKFRHQVETFYDQKARDTGGIVGKDRYGQVRTFPFLGVSCALLHLQPGRRETTIDELVTTISILKKQAKQHSEGIVEAEQD